MNASERRAQDGGRNRDRDRDSGASAADGLSGTREVKPPEPRSRRRCGGGTAGTTREAGGTLATLLLGAAALLVGACGPGDDGGAPEPRRGEASVAQDGGEPSEGARQQPTEDGAGMAMEGMATDGSVRLSSEEISTFGITFGRAEIRPLGRTIRVAGYVEFDETRVASVSPRFPGWAERLHVDFTGQRVARGDPLLDVYSPDLVTAQEELILAASMVEKVGESSVEGVAVGARDLLDSARRRLEHWQISDDQIEEILASGEARRTLTLHAPEAGVVTEKGVIEGSSFPAGAELYRIADLSRVWVNAEVFEGDIPFVREGMRAELTVDARPAERLAGRVEYVYPTLSDRTRSMRVRISLPNPGIVLKPGMYATAHLEAQVAEALAVPASAVLQTGERAVAFVDVGGGRLAPRELRLGVRADDHVQVLEGLEAGDRVVTSAHFLLDSESNLAEVMRSMMAIMDMSDMDMDMEGMEMDMDDMDMEEAAEDTTAAPDTVPEGHP